MNNVHDGFGFLTDSADREVEEEMRMLREDARRKTLIEKYFPQVKFHRAEGLHTSFGAIPQQAHGTVSGRPFYYRMRHDRASLEVFPKHIGNQAVTVPANSIVQPMFSAAIADVTGDDESDRVATTSGAVDLFGQLLSKLEPTEPCQLSTSKGPSVDELLDVLSDIFPDKTITNHPQIKGLMIRVSQDSHLVVDIDDFGDWQAIQVRLYVGNELVSTRRSSFLGDRAVIQHETLDSLKDVVLSALCSLDYNLRAYSDVAFKDIEYRRNHQDLCLQTWAAYNALLSLPPVQPENIVRLALLAELDPTDYFGMKDSGSV